MIRRSLVEDIICYVKDGSLIIDHFNDNPPIIIYFQRDILELKINLDNEIVVRTDEDVKIYSWRGELLETIKLPQEYPNHYLLNQGGFYSSDPYNLQQVKILDTVISYRDILDDYKPEDILDEYVIENTDILAIHSRDSIKLVSNVEVVSLPLQTLSRIIVDDFDVFHAIDKDYRLFSFSLYDRSSNTGDIRMKYRVYGTGDHETFINIEDKLKYEIYRPDLRYIEGKIVIVDEDKIMVDGSTYNVKLDGLVFMSREIYYLKDEKLGMIDLQGAEIVLPHAVRRNLVFDRERNLIAYSDIDTVYLESLTTGNIISKQYTNLSILDVQFLSTDDNFLGVSVGNDEDFGYVEYLDLDDFSSEGIVNQDVNDRFFGMVKNAGELVIKDWDIIVGLQEEGSDNEIIFKNSSNWDILYPFLGHDGMLYFSTNGSIVIYDINSKEIQSVLNIRLGRFTVYGNKIYACEQNLFGKYRGVVSIDIGNLENVNVISGVYKFNLSMNVYKDRVIYSDNNYIYRDDSPIYRLGYNSDPNIFLYHDNIYFQDNLQLKSIPVDIKDIKLRNVYKFNTYLYADLVSKIDDKLLLKVKDHSVSILNIANKQIVHSMELDYPVEEAYVSRQKGLIYFLSSNYEGQKVVTDFKLEVIGTFTDNLSLVNDYIKITKDKQILTLEGEQIGEVGKYWYLSFKSNNLLVYSIDEEIIAIYKQDIIKIPGTEISILNDTVQVVGNGQNIFRGITDYSFFQGTKRIRNTEGINFNTSTRDIIKIEGHHPLNIGRYFSKLFFMDNYCYLVVNNMVYLDEYKELEQETQMLENLSPEAKGNQALILDILIQKNIAEMREFSY